MLNAALPTPADVLTPAQDASWVLILSLVVAIGLVYCFCAKKFNERSVTENKDYVYQFLPSQLATPQEYNKGFFTYFGAMALMVALFSLIGPKGLVGVGLLPRELADQVGNVAFPLAVALVLTGVLPNVPVLQEVERWLREYAHQIAYIPTSALATAERLSTADFDFSLYAAEAMQSEELRGVEASDFTAPRRSLEYAWARLSCLVYAQKSCLLGAAAGLETGLLRAYQTDLDLIEASKKSMEADVAAYREARRKDGTYANQQLNQAIRNNLYKLYILLGCAVRLKKQPHQDVELALMRLGFKLDGDRDDDNTADLKLVGIAILAGLVLLLQFAGVLIGQLKLWPVGDFFPNDWTQCFRDTVWVLTPHVVAIMVADLMRKRAIHAGRWFDRAGRPVTANHVRVAIAAGLAGGLAVVLWGLIWAPPTLNGVKVDAPNALLAMASGAFYVWHLDNAARNLRPAVWIELTSQAGLTALAGLIASTTGFSVTLALLGASASSAADRIVFNAIIAAAVGLALASYFPKAAMRVDPLDAQRKQRLDKLEAAARIRFGAAADGWLERPHPALGFKSPRASAAHVEGFDHVMSLLQGPQEVAA